MIEPTGKLNLSPTQAITLVTCGVMSGGILLAEHKDYPDLHTMLDTGMFLLPGVLALLFRDMGVRLNHPFLKLLAITFAITSILEFVHVLVGVEWPAVLDSINRASEFLRPATWPPPAYVLPIGIGCSVLVMRRKSKRVFGLAVALIVLSAGLLAAFHWLPRYTAPTSLGVTRPALILAPLLWVVVGLVCWRWRTAERVLPAFALMSAVLFTANVLMLYSRTPHDAPAMVAHLGTVGGHLILLLAVMQMASVDMLERIRAERELALLNQELESRVLDRTSRLNTANELLAVEVTERNRAQQKLLDQLNRLGLLQQITRGIGERHDLQSIFRVVIRRLEDSLPIDFGCICLYDPGAEVLTVATVGLRSEGLAIELAMSEKASIAIDENGLSRSVRGKLVYEPDIGELSFPFPQRMAKAGLRSLVIAPLLVESKVFGILVAGRREANSFSSGTCEFVRQLSDHVALAAHQAQLYSALQQAYDDLRQTQQTVMQQERLRALGQMASGVAHDINNALSPMVLYTESLLDTEQNLSASGRDKLKTIQNAIDDVAETVALMREFYRQREPQLALGPLQPNRLVQQVIDLTRARWSDMAQREGVAIELVTELVPNLPTFMGVESEIREALTNLIVNAVDAMPDGGTLTMRTGVSESAAVSQEQSPARSVYLEVTDTGVGMEEATRQRCLEPFFTTKGECGTGLGLAMVYGTAERHSADLEVESTVSEGTTVRLRFSVPATVAPEAAQASTPDAMPARMRLLIVDDDPVVLNSLRETLISDGHQVFVANGGQQGIDTFRAALERDEPFAVVMTDLGMPYVDGRQVASAVKQASPLTPVILLTGWGQRLVAEGEVPLNVDRVLSKPPKVRDLRKALVQCLPAE